MLERRWRRKLGWPQLRPLRAAAPATAGRRAGGCMSWRLREVRLGAWGMSLCALHWAQSGGNCRVVPVGGALLAQTCCALRCPAVPALLAAS